PPSPPDTSPIPYTTLFRSTEVIQVCMQLGIMANINRRLDKDSIMAIADEFGYGVEFVSELGEEEVEEGVVEETGALLPRPAVVTDRKSTRLNSSHQIISYA